MIARLHSRFVVGWVLAAVLVGGASAAEPLPDRRGARPTTPAPSSTPSAAKPAAGPQQNLIELYSEIETLQTQLREVRGQLEEQTHELNRLKSRQQESMVDFDRRLRELDRRTSGQAGVPNTGSAPTAVVTPPVSTTSSPSVRVAPAEQQQYDAAFGLMKQGRYEEAAKSFREFIARNPKGGLADNAQYWVGEAAYVMRDFRVALDEFGKVVNDYPQSAKLPDALLKIGYTHNELGQHAKAREILSQVVSRYPNTTVAKSAALRLEKIPKNGKQ